MYIFLNRSFIDKISVFPIYFLIKIFQDTCQTLATGNTYAVFMTSRVRTETRASSASVYDSSVTMLNLASSAITKLYYAMLYIPNCVSNVGHLQLALVVRSKTKSSDVFNVLLA